MPARLLMASTVALGLLFVAIAVGFLADWPVGGRATRFGLVPTWELAAILVAMAVGGWIARTGFRGPAVALVAVAWLASLLAASLFAPAGAEGTGLPLLRENGLALLVGIAAAWVAAGAGERLARRRQSAG